MPSERLFQRCLESSSENPSTVSMFSHSLGRGSIMMPEVQMVEA
jgi:hypothetical protein